MAAKMIIAIATTAEINPIVIAGETSDRDNTIMMLRTNKVQVSEQNKYSFLDFSTKSP
ncbi:MAG: hypothetical protein M3114_09325 [Thermoproteota archaeon]|nr:hypothetical protein [Thermoproteota archaeon]